MGKDSKIQWTQNSWNPWQGCKKVSKGCKYCYMYRDKKRWKQDPSKVVRSKDATFNKPLSWKEPKLIFTCSWSDWFIDEADEWRDDAWKVIKDTPHHIYQILTKRPERILDHLPDDWGDGYENVWIGISAETDKELVERMKYFSKIKAKVKFISAEPLLNYIDLESNHITSSDVDWIIIGGESGNKHGEFLYRPCKLEWIRDIISTSKAFGIPVFVKQLGTHLAQELGLKDRHGGEIAEFPEDIQIREMPKYYIK